MRSFCVSDFLTCCEILLCFSEILSTHKHIAEQDSNKGSSVVSAIIQPGYTDSCSSINLLVLRLGSEIESQRIIHIYKTTNVPIM